MLRYGIFLIIALVQVVSSVQDDAREKRQITFGTRVVGKETFFIFDGDDLVQLTSIDSDNTGVVMVGDNDVVVCDLIDNTVTFMEQSMLITRGNIEQCVNISGQGIESFAGAEQVMFSGGGVLYYDFNRVLFIADSASTVSNFIEQQRPSFVPALPPVDVAVVRRMDELVLNLNDRITGGGVTAPSDLDAIRLFGASCREVQGGQALIYNGDTIFVRQGTREISRDEMIDGLETILSQNIAGQICNVVTRDAGTRPGFLRGPGYLCTGRSALEMSEMVAFFTNSSDVQNMIMNSLVNRQLAVSRDGPSIVGQFTPIAGEVLILLNGSTSNQFSEGLQLVKTSESVEVRNQLDIALATYGCPNGVTLGIFTENMVMRIAAPDSFGPITIPEGGETVLFNPENCMVFAYPTAFMTITDLIRNGTDTAMLTPPPPVQFTITSTSFGARNLFTDGMQVLTTTSSSAFQVGMGQSIAYSGNTVTVRQGGSTINSFGNIGMFTANTAFNRARSFNGSADQIFSGPGTLYRDRSGRAFFTTLPEVMEVISSSITNAARQNVMIVDREVNDTTILTLETGGTAFFNLPSQETSMVVPSGSGVSYTMGVIRVDRAMNIPASSSLTYFPNEEVLQIDDMNITSVQSFFIGDPGNPGMPENVRTERTIAGGGILYRGMNDAFYWPLNTVPTSDADINIIQGLGVSVIEEGFPMPIDNINSGIIFDNSRFQFFRMGAPGLFPGRGYLAVNGDSFFYTTDQNLIGEIPEAFARFNPPMVIYNNITGIVTVTSFGSGDILGEFSIESRTIQAPGGRIMVRGGNITSSSGQVIASGINMFSYFNGFETDVVTDSEEGNFFGGGFLVIDSEAGTAFYTTSPIVSRSISGTITSTIRTFRGPVIPDTLPGVVTSKLNEINTGFGQLLTVYQGADVNLRCFTENANPPSTFTFSMRFNSSFEFVTIMNGSDFRIVRNGPNDVTLSIPAIALDEDEAEFRCQARNPAGSSSRTTRVIVRPPVPPMIDNSFFGGAGKPGAVPITAISDDMRDPFQPIVRPRMDGSPVIADTFLINEVVSIGCKASGRPKPSIVWFEERGGVRTAVNVSNPDICVESRRQGQSVLTVDFGNNDPVCSTFVCVADNRARTEADAATSVEGSVQICRLRYDSEQGMNPILSDCSGTCGIGVQTISQPIQLFNNSDTPILVTIDDLPAGLVKPNIQFCTNPVNMTCPVITIEFQAGEFSNCSSFCGEGTQERVVDCVMTTDGMEQTVNDTECVMRGMIKPAEEIRCDSGRCPEYIDEGFGECSSTCRGGRRSRNLQCILVNDNGIIESVQLDICTNYSLSPMPILEEDCNINIPCPVRYFPEQYGECDDFNCQVRHIYCANFDPSDPEERWPVPEEECVAQGLQRMSSVRSCNGGTCSFGLWSTTITSEGGVCSEACGPGRLEQDVVCVNNTDQDVPVIEDGFCNAALRPANVVPCFLRNCPGQCLLEPTFCPFLKQVRLCKDPRLTDMVAECCISCPFQASPIPPLTDAVVTTEADTTEAATTP